MQEAKENFLSRLIRFILRAFGFPLRFLLKNPKIFLFIIVVLLSVAGTIFLVKKNPSLFGISNKAINELEDERKRLVEEVGKIIELPQETPTIATVSDVEKLRNQTFFSKAQNGDKVLIFTDSKKAILYRPSEKRIIEVGIVNIRQQENFRQEINSVTIQPTPQTLQDISPTLNLTSTPTPTSSE